MARAVNGGSPDAASDAAYSVEDIDAGWEEAPPRPTSMVVPADRSRRVSTPPPSPWSVFAGPHVQKHGRASTAAAFVVGSIAVVLAGTGGYFAAHRQGAVAPVMTAVPAPSLAATPVVAAPPPSPAPAPSLDAAETLLAPEVSPVTVLITVIPKQAAIFHHGERLGAGLVAVNVGRNEKQRLTAVLPGYEKARFTVDGTRDTVNVSLRRIPPPAAPVMAPSDPAPDAPSSAREPPSVPTETSNATTEE